MTAIDWNRMRPLLARLLELPESEHAGYLAQACGGDDELARTAQRLFAEERLNSDFLDSPFEHRAPDLAAPAPDATVGPYRLVRELGRGGMGAVWLAERAGGFRQQVALKLVKPGMDTDEVVRRFQRERQLLADLDHPGIVRLLDGGATAEGRPYLVLELVDGVPLDVHCRERVLDLQARLELFARVCEAVEAAHALGIVHRDLKPSNVLVTGSGEPKVLDFGIAKLLSDEGSELSLLTRTGERLLTPRYAAPEQVRAEACTTATDVYALGVMLYELLCDRPPYEVETATLREIETAVCGQLPRKPSAVVARTRSRRLVGDLDVIAMRALAKEPERRYRDAGHLARDIRRHLAHEPIGARPDSASYRLVKFVRRNRWLVGSTAAVFVALAAGLALATAQYFESERQRQLADERADEAEWSAYTALVGERIANLAAGRVSFGSDQPHLGGWEWRHIEARSELFTRVLYQKVGGSLLALDGTGEILALMDGEDCVLLDTRTGAVQRRVHLPGTTWHVLSPDAQQLAYAKSPHVFVRELDTERELACWDLGGPVERLCFVPGTRLLAAATTSEVVLVSLDEPDFRRQLADWKSRDLAVAPSGDRIAVGRSDGTVHVFGLDDPTLDTSFSISEEPNGVEAVALSHTGRYAAGASVDGAVRIWDLEQHRPLSMPLNTRQFCTGLAFRADRDELTATGTAIHVWDLASGRYRPLAGANTTIRTLIAHPVRPLLYTAAQDGRVLEWAADAEPVPRHHVVNGNCRNVAASPDSSNYAVSIGGGPDRLLLVETSSGTVLARRDASLGSLRDLARAPDGSVVVTRHEGALVLSGETLETLAELAIPDANCVTFTPDGSSFLVGTKDGRLFGCTTADTSIADERATPFDAVSVVVVHPDGRRVTVAGTADPPCNLQDLDLVTGRWSPQQTPFEGTVMSLGVDADGRWLAIGGRNLLQVRSTATGEVLLEEPLAYVKSVLFTPDRKRLIAAYRSQVALFDTERWRLAANFVENERGIQDMALCPDGTLLTCDWAGDVRVWRVRR